WNFNPDTLTSVLVPDNFYYGKVPDLKNDSQYQMIHFDAAYSENRSSAQAEISVLVESPRDILQNKATNIQTTSSKLSITETVNGVSKTRIRSFSEYAASVSDIKDV